MVFAMKGPDATALTHEQRLRLTHQFESALRLLNERVHVYQYFVKEQVEAVFAGIGRARCGSGVVQRRSAYLNGRRSQLFHGLSIPGSTAGARSVQRRTSLLPATLRKSRCCDSRTVVGARHVTFLEAQLEGAARTLGQLASSVAVQLADCSLRKLPKQEAFGSSVDSSILIPRGGRSHLRYDTHLDYFIADSPVECHRDHLRVGSRAVTALSMKEPPRATYAHMLADLLRVPCEFVACLEWQRLSNEKIRQDIHARRRHFFNKRVSIVNYVAPDTQPDEMLVDDSAGATVNQLGDALIEIETNGHFFGSASLTLLLHGPTENRFGTGPPKLSRRSPLTTASLSRKATTCSMHGWPSSPATTHTTFAGWPCSKRTAPT